MKNTRSLAMIATSLLLGLLAVTLAGRWLHGQEMADTINVLVAKRDLPMGTRLQAEMLTTIRWPSAAPIDAPVSKLDQAQGRVINMQLLKGEPLVQSKLAAIGEIGGLSAVLPEGQRAVTVKVNEIMGVAGFALPGNYVDLMVNTPDGQDNPVSKIVIERIKVLAVAQDVASTENKPRVVNAVTLEVSPEQAEKIDLARSVGTLSLVLRSQIDSRVVQTEGARKTDLLPALQDRHASPAIAPRVRSPHATARQTARDPQAIGQVEVIRGLKRTVE